MANPHSRKYKNFDKPLTVERLKEVLTFDAETGKFGRREQSLENPYAKRARVGCVRPDGYIVIRIDGKTFRAQRLAWLYVTGQWPSGVIDHINGQRDDNRFANLRDTSQAKNLLNRGRQSNNKSGYKGVSLHRGTGKWTAWIKNGPKQRYLGLYATPEMAAAAYQAAARELHGEFAFLGDRKKRAA